MIKMIVVDLDGTLLKSDKTISDFTKDTLKSCRENGIKIVYGTARGESAKSHAPAEMFDGRINMNGAVARAKEKLLYNSMIKMDLARDLLVACDKYGLKTAAQSDGIHYSNFDVNGEWPEMRRNFQITDFRRHNIDAEKLYTVVRNNSDVEFIKRYIPSDLYLTVSRDGLAMIMHADATKMKAINALADYWAIGKEEIVAFGDDLNDIDMLVGCGVGVAMGNGVDEVKVIADEVCETNDDDGVARWINLRILGR